MKIDRTQVKGPAAPHRAAARSAGPLKESIQAPGTSPADKVQVSTKARQVSALKSKLQTAPEVRIDLVERIKTQIEDGQYSVDAHKVADRLLKSRVLDE